MNDNLVPLKENTLEQQEKLRDVKVEYFTEVQKMPKKVKYMEKHLRIVSQVNLKMESLQTKIEDLDKWRNMKKSVPCGLSAIKDYDVRLHTLATNECQELASMFEERARKSQVGMMSVYDKSVQDV